MSLGHLEAIPIDTHIYQIAKRCYLKHLPKQKSVNDKLYNEIGDFFRNLYGPLAGWAHTVCSLLNHLLLFFISCCCCNICSIYIYCRFYFVLI